MSDTPPSESERFEAAALRLRKAAKELWDAEEIVNRLLEAGVTQNAITLAAVESVFFADMCTDSVGESLAQIGNYVGMSASRTHGVGAVSEVGQRATSEHNEMVSVSELGRSRPEHKN